MTGAGKLGKKPFVPDDRDIRFRAIAPALDKIAPPPPRFGFGGAYLDWGMLGNGPDPTAPPEIASTGVGDCYWAGAAHETKVFNKSIGIEVPFDGVCVVSDYSAQTGYILGNEETDLGTDPRQGFLYRQKTGIIDAVGSRHKIGAFAFLTPGDVSELLTAAYWFEWVGVGFQLPDTAMDQFNRGQPWDVVPGARNEGGHYVPMTGRRQPNNNGGLTWATRQAITDRFIETYMDEGWVAVSEEELRNGVSRRGLDLTALLAKMHDLGLQVPQPTQ